MSYRADKLVIDTHTHRPTDAGDDNTRRPKLALGKKWSYLYMVLILVLERDIWHIYGRNMKISVMHSIRVSSQVSQTALFRIHVLSLIIDLQPVWTETWVS